MSESDQVDAPVKLTRYFDVLDTVSSEDIPETLELINRLRQKLLAENAMKQRKYFHLKSPLERAMLFTGMSKNTILGFKDELFQHKQPTEQDIEVYEGNIEDAILNFYKSSILPSTKMLHRTMHEHNQLPSSWCISKLRNQLKNMGYLIRKTALKPYKYIIKDEKIVFEKYNYLKRVTQLRQDGHSFYYVDENLYDSERNYVHITDLKRYEKTDWEDKSHSVVYSVSPNGVQAIAFFSEITETNFENWCFDTFLPILSPNSVVVLNKTPHLRQQSTPRPTLHSLKRDIIKYLDEHEIPHKDGMMKQDLIDLVDGIPKSHPKCKIAEVLEAYGHIVLCRPRSLVKLSPAYIVRAIVKKSLAAQTQLNSLSSVMTAISESLKGQDCGAYEEIIAMEEAQTMEQEMELDEILDRLKSKDSNILNDSDLDSEYSDSDVM